MRTIETNGSVERERSERNWMLEIAVVVGIVVFGYFVLILQDNPAGLFDQTVAPSQSLPLPVSTD
jgi:hypothetical protein